MTQAQFVRYWIFPTNGDPLPTIGSGFRTVEVKIGRKHVLVRGTTDEQSTHITTQRWNQIPHLLHENQPLTVAVDALRHYRPTYGD